MISPDYSKIISAAFSASFLMVTLWCCVELSTYQYEPDTELRRCLLVGRGFSSAPSPSDPEPDTAPGPKVAAKRFSKTASYDDQTDFELTGYHGENRQGRYMSILDKYIKTKDQVLRFESFGSDFQGLKKGDPIKTQEYAFLYGKKWYEAICTGQDTKAQSITYRFLDQKDETDRTIREENIQKPKRFKVGFTPRTELKILEGKLQKLVRVPNDLLTYYSDDRKANLLQWRDTKAELKPQLAERIEKIFRQRKTFHSCLKGGEHLKDVDDRNKGIIKRDLTALLTGEGLLYNWRRHTLQK